MTAKRERKPGRSDESIERRMRPQQDEADNVEEQGSAAKEVHGDTGEDRDPEEEGSAGRPQR